MSTSFNPVLIWTFPSFLYLYRYINTSVYLLKDKSKVQKRRLSFKTLRLKTKCLRFFGSLPYDTLFGPVMMHFIGMYHFKKNIFYLKILIKHSISAKVTLYWNLEVIETPPYHQFILFPVSGAKMFK